MRDNENCLAKNITIEKTKWYGNDNCITEEGTWGSPFYSDNDGFQINCSSILTKLIQETGRFCEQYASDLFIHWKKIEKKLNDPDYEGGCYFFGIRESGVDSTSYIDHEITTRKRGEKSVDLGNYYRKIYRLDVTVENEKIEMKLFLTDRYYFEN